MKVKVFGCRKFSRIVSERLDRQLTASENHFLERHRQVCTSCKRSERSADYALNMLRAATLEAEVAPMFEDRVIRRLRVQTVRDRLSYWSPALVGAIIACTALCVALHLASATSAPGRVDVPVGSASRVDAPTPVQSLDLSAIPEFDR